MINYKKLSFLFAFACFYGNNTYAQETEQLDQILIQGKTFAQKKNLEGKVIDRLDSVALQSFQGQNLSNAINALPGVYVAGANSKAGSVKNISIRGGSGKQVLILIDGIPVNDPSSIDTAIDFNAIPIENVQEIELMKGASSTLYGSGAAVAVINIITKKAGKKPINVNFTTTTKTEQIASDNLSFNRFDNNLFISGKSNKTNYSLQGSYVTTDGISAAASPSDEEFEKDAYKAKSLNFKLGHKIGDKIRLDAFYMHQKNNQDTDNGAFADGLVSTGSYELNRVGFIPQYAYDKGAVKWQNSYSNIERYSNDDNYQGGVNTSIFRSIAFRSDLFNQMNLTENLSNISGLSFEYQNGRNYGPFEVVQGLLNQFRIVDLYTNFSFKSEFGLNLDAGVRYNYHNVYKGNFSYDFGANFDLFSKSKLNASYSTAYITPSLYQLYSSFGNLDLTPEEYRSWEVGFVLNEFDFMSFSATYFDRIDKNPIGFLGSYANLVDQDYDFNGIELGLDLYLVQNLDLNVNYSFTNIDEDASTTVPSDLIRSSVSYSLGAHRFGLLYQYNSERQASFWNGTGIETVEFDPYQLLDLNYRYAFKKYLSLNFSVNNILNEEYQERPGYSTLGRNIMIGLNLNI